MSQSAALKCLDRYGFPLAGLTAAEQAVRTEAAARETKLQEKWSRQVGTAYCCCPFMRVYISLLTYFCQFLSVLVCWRIARVYCTTTACAPADYYMAATEQHTTTEQAEAACP